MKILIADDNPENLKLLRAILETEGHQVFTAADGEHALEVLNQEKVEAIISDILMPRMDGYRFCLEVRKSEKFSAIPFIVYTSTYTSPSDEKTALDLGADKFIKKPASTAQILQALEDVTKGTRQRAAPAGSVDELGLMKEYSERLVAKLEQQNWELEAQSVSLRRKEADLTNSHAQLRALALRLQAAREEERIRIARELHDGLGSMLTGIEIGLTWMRTVMEGKVKKLPRRALVHKIVQLDGLICDTTVRVRELCRELRPSILDDLGLIPAIEWQAHEFEDRTGIRCEPKNEMKEITTTPEESTAVFRIFQEILTNVARHAHASRVHVSLKKSGANLELEVKDNGI